MGKTALSYTIKYGKIMLGSALYAVGFQFFAYPNSIVPGGVTGIAMIINYITNLPVGVMSIILNLPLFIMAWKRFGYSFLVSSFVGMMLCSVFVDLFSLIDFVATTEPLLAAIYGGIIKGFGLGIVFTTGATTGGVDIVAKFLRAKYQYINFGTIMLLIDVVIIAAFAVIFSRYDSAMYAIICMFMSSKVIDLVLYGAVNSKVCYIITDKHVEIKNAISQRLNRGVTYIYGEGAWSGKAKNIILCVIKTNQIVELKQIIQENDPESFLIVSDSREVFGKGFTYIGDEK
jgi:uncharacterized membrane-anchored protein YitT (DUF2179 family)